MLTLQELRQRTDKDSWFLFHVVSQACEYRLQDTIGEYAGKLIWSNYVHSISDALRNSDYSFHLSGRYFNSRFIERSNFFTPLGENTNICKILFPLLFDAHIKEFVLDNENETPAKQIFRYDFFENNPTPPISKTYFLNFIADRKAPLKRVIGDVSCIIAPMATIRPFDDEDEMKLEQQLQAFYAKIPSYKDAWKSPKEVKEIIANEIKKEKISSKNWINTEKELRKIKGFPYEPTDAEYLRFLRTTGQNIKIRKFTLHINEILDLEIPLIQ